MLHVRQSFTEVQVVAQKLLGLLPLPPDGIEISNMSGLDVLGTFGDGYILLCIYVLSFFSLCLFNVVLRYDMYHSFIKNQACTMYLSVYLKVIFNDILLNTL